MRSESEVDRNLRAELRKAENRERVAQCKLDRLKERFDKLYNDVACSQKALDNVNIECENLRRQLARAQEERERASQEALMWRTQLFERMELLETTKHQMRELEQTIELERERAEHAALVQRSSHEELKKRDRERLFFELRIEDLQKAEKEAREQANDLLEALTDAETAISDFQRANDRQEREIDGLKSLGASLSEQLRQTAGLLDQQKKHSLALREELRHEREQSALLLSEFERLKDSYSEVQERLTGLEQEIERGVLRRVGKEKAGIARREKLAEYPAAAAQAETQRIIGRDALSRATKKMTGWFRLSDRDGSQN